MFSFTQSPKGCVTTGNYPDYVIDSDTPATLFVRITDAAARRQLATKCFVDVNSCRFDITPAVQRNIAYRPQHYPSGFPPLNDRYLRVEVAARQGAAAGEEVTAPQCRFFSSTAGLTPAPRLLTTMPLQRILRTDEEEELAIAADAPVHLTLTARSRKGETVHRFYSPGEGIVFFHLLGAQYAEAEQVEVAAEGCDPVIYTMAAPLSEGVRLAWRTTLGSLEHYTFPVVHTSSLTADREKQFSREGYRRPVQRLRKLVSAYESRPVLEALAELLSAPQVWVVTPEGYRPAEVISDHAVTHRYGVLSHMEIEIRDTAQHA